MSTNPLSAVDSVVPTPAKASAVTAAKVAAGVQRAPSQTPPILKALGVLELLWEVLVHLKRPSAYALARTCQLLFHAGIDRVWQDLPHPKYLFHSLDKDFLRLSLDGAFIEDFLRIPGPKDLERLCCNADRVRSLSVRSEREETIVEDLLLRLMPTVRFNRMRRLQMDLKSITTIHLFEQLLEPTLKNLELTCGAALLRLSPTAQVERTLALAFEKLFTSDISITDFKLLTFTLCPKLLACFVMKWEELKSFDLEVWGGYSDCNLLFRALASRQELKRLRLRIHDEQNILPIPHRSCPSSFVSLSVLDSTYPVVLPILQVGVSPLVNLTVEITVSPIINIGKVATFMEAIASFSSSLQSVTVVIKTSLGATSEEDKPSRFPLQPLLSCYKLHLLSISDNNCLYLPLSDPETREIGCRLLLLKKLKWLRPLTEALSSLPSLCSLDTLSHLTRCPLEELDIPLDARHNHSGLTITPALKPRQIYVHGWIVERGSVEVLGAILDQFLVCDGYISPWQVQSYVLDDDFDVGLKFAVWRDVKQRIVKRPAWLM